MILKSLSVRSKSGVKKLLTYLFKDEQKLLGENQRPILIRHNIRAKTKIENWIKEFDENEKFRLRKTKANIYAYHFIISFSNKDREHINETMLRSIANHFIKLRAEDSLLIGAAHFSDNVHLHFLMSPIKYRTGESNRLSKAEFQKLKNSLQAFQRRIAPSLIHSLPMHNRSKLKAGEKDRLLDHQSHGRKPQKEALLKCLKMVYETSKSLEGFVTTLVQQGYPTYYRSGKLAGVRSKNGLKFRFSRLGYDSDKLAQLDSNRIKEEKTISELRNLRQEHASGREKSEKNNSRGYAREINESNQGGNNAL